MSLFKKSQVVMLPTNKTSDIHLADDVLVQEEICQNTIHYEYQNLYILSDDKPKVGDYYLVELFKITGESIGLQLEQCKTIDDVWVNNSDVVSTRHIENCKKIIATTNISLSEIPEGDTFTKLIPELSQEFIEEYIDGYNEGDIVNDVLVQYEEYDISTLTSDYSKYKNLSIDSLVVNKDNTIIIKKLKDNWTREEVENLIY